ncbi:anaphase-promoting complex subunit [Thraustotheca clavata]|uniref:Anaphase-promoting complex subunit n=1 Tax=Thraustotheca clavata TaxID=74557 RepID=A0A1V9Z0F1_9STRA|nr:anaphase-promoting complex subunit [Thraustotheca clavata]
MTEALDQAIGLARARRDLSVRGLKHAATFACELYAGLPPYLQQQVPSSAFGEVHSSADGVLELARSYYDVAEYARAAHVLEMKRTALSSIEFFLLHYARYLAGERRKEALLTELKPNMGSKIPIAKENKPTNPALPKLLEDLSTADENGMLDAFGLYLYAIVLKQSMGVDTARSQCQQLLKRSISIFPWNWSAWMELDQVLSQDAASSFDKVEISPSCPWMRDLFQVHLYLENNQATQAFDLLTPLQKQFPTCHYILAQTASAQYHLQDFDQAHETFSALTKADPYRVEQMDLFSNVLYVKEDKSGLSSLAQHLQRVDKYRPETCQHERAILYFSRALTLDPQCLSAWTLIGHEYIELRNTAAAIEVYRRAIDINPKDYRAWYGLGQAYEILELIHYSVYYYQKAAAIRPYDARMWCALGGCYEKLPTSHTSQAIMCYQRAIANKDTECIAIYRLAQMYEKEDNNEKAAECYQMYWRERGLTQVDSPEATSAVFFLAQYFKQKRQFRQAVEWCNRLLDRQGPVTLERDEAKAMLQTMRNLEYME